MAYMQLVLVLALLLGISGKQKKIQWKLSDVFFLIECRSIDETIGNLTETRADCTDRFENTIRKFELIRKTEFKPNITELDLFVEEINDQKRELFELKLNVSDALNSLVHSFSIVHHVQLEGIRISSSLMDDFLVRIEGEIRSFEKHMTVFHPEFFSDKLLITMQLNIPKYDAIIAHLPELEESIQELVKNPANETKTKIQTRITNDSSVFKKIAKEIGIEYGNALSDAALQERPLDIGQEFETVNYIECMQYFSKYFTDLLEVIEKLPGKISKISFV